MCFKFLAYPLKVVSLLQGSLDLKLVMWPIEANGPCGRLPPSSYIKLPPPAPVPAQTRKFELYLPLTATDRQFKI